MADRLVCDGSETLRSCDIACESTALVTGTDEQGELEYAFSSYYCDGALAGP
jgi:hypothetical protein